MSCNLCKPVFLSTAVTVPTGGSSRPTPLECRALTEVQIPIDTAVSVPHDGEACEAPSPVSGGVKSSCGKNA